MCEKRTKQLSDFQDFVDNLDENMDELDTRDLSDADITGDTETLSEPKNVDYKKDTEDSRTTCLSDQAIPRWADRNKGIEAKVIGPTCSKQENSGPSLSDVVVDECLSDRCDNDAEHGDDFCETCIIRLYRESSMNQY